jgi:hypothetical protein
MGVTAMASIVHDNEPFHTWHQQHMARLHAAAIDDSLLGTLANPHDFSATTLLNRDYTRCAETMIGNYGSRALGLAERRALEMLGDGNSDVSDIWTRVAATIRWIR